MTTCNADSDTGPRLPLVLNLDSTIISVLPKTYIYLFDNTDPTQMSFPDEVMDHILSFLQSDLYTLKQCAQSHPVLSKLSERHIYANIILRDHSYVHDALRTSKLIKILHERPNIAKHVRSLRVYVSTESASEHLCGFASVLPMFSGLRNLEIKASNGHLSWRQFPQIFHQSFVDFLHSQGKKKFSISIARHFPLSVLNICKDMRVTLDRCQDTQYDKESSTKDGWLSSLEPFEHLSLICCSEACLESILAWPRIHTLRSLEYKVGWCRDELWNFLPRMILACSNSLTNFCFDINDYYSNCAVCDAHPSATLAGLHHLERLSVKAEISVEAELLSYHQSPIPFIAELISTALASPSLKEVFLHFKFWDISSKVPCPEDIWLQFVPLVATCSSLFIKFFISTTLPTYISEDISSVFPSAADCEELRPYVKTGVVVVIPEIPTNF